MAAPKTPSTILNLPSILALGVIASSAALPVSGDETMPSPVAATTSAASQDDAALLAQASPAGTAVISKRYLNFPISDTGKKYRTRILVDGVEIAYLNLALAAEKPDWWAFLDVDRYRGKKVEIKVDGLPPSQPVFLQDNQIEDAADLYHEPRRAQVHFSTARGWQNDANGLIYDHGLYHLYYQHDPFSMGNENTSWGHAVSTDLLHWKEMPTILFPQSGIGACWSGATFFDRKNQLGLKTGDNDPIVAFYFRTQQGDNYAISNDRGFTFDNYAANPALYHPGARTDSPRVIWYAPGGYWVAVAYDHIPDPHDPKGFCATVGFYRSTDLKKWEKTSDLGPTSYLAECPDLFPLPLDGNPKKQKWVLILSDASYIVGSFDGKTLRNEAGDPATVHDLQSAIVPGTNYYATMTWYNMPPGDNRRVQISWMPGNAELLPGTHFNEQMSLPVELTLHSSAEGSKLHMFPVRELESLRCQDHAFTNVVLGKDTDPLAGLTPDGPLDVEAELRLSDAAHIEFSLRGYRILYDAGVGTITFAGATCPKLMISRVLTQNGILRLRMIIDRGSMECFANDGELDAPMLANVHAPPDPKLSLLLRQGAATVPSLHVYELNSIWP